MRNPNKRFKLWLLVAALLLTAVFVTCCKKPEANDPAIIGDYYCETADGEYTLSLGEYTYTLTGAGANESGKYAIKGTSLTFTAANGNITMLASVMDSGNLSVAIGDDMPRIFLAKIQYTVTFDSREGSSVAAATVVNGKSLSDLPVPTRQDYVFAGWYLDAACNTAFVFGETAVTGNITLYARWLQASSASEYVVSFNYGQNNVVEVNTVNGKVYYSPTAPVMDGSTFVGWWLSIDGDENKLVSKFVEGDTTFDRDTTLYPVFTKTENGKLAAPVVQVEDTRVYWSSVIGADKYHITVAPVDGQAVLDRNVTATSVDVPFATYSAGEYIVTVTAVSDNVDVLSSEPTVRHFANRMLRPVDVFGVNGNILTFVGVPNATKYLVTAICADGVHNAETVRVDTGATLQYDFSACQMDGGAITFVVTAVGDNYVESVSEPYALKRELGKPVGFAVENEYLSWTAVPGATGYEVYVKGGDNADDGIITGKVVVTEPLFDLRYYGKRSLVISVTPVGRTYNSPEETEYTYVKNTLACPANLTVEESRYLTWTANDGAVKYEVRVDDGEPTVVTQNKFDLLQAVAGDHTVVVRAVDSDNVASAWSNPLSFNNADTKPTSLRYEAGRVVWNAAVSVVPVDGYLVKVGLDGQIADVESTTSAAVKFTAAGVQTVYVCSYIDDNLSAWASLEVTVHTLHCLNGDEDSPLYFATGDEVTTPTATKMGYTFTGWYSAEVGGSLYMDTHYTADTDTTLYAHWAANKYTVTFDLCGGTGDFDLTEEVTFGEAFKWNIPAAAIEDKGFAGWYTVVNGGGDKLTDADGSSLVGWAIDGNATVYACYRDILQYRLMKDDTYSVTCGDGAYSVTSIVVPDKYNNKLITVVDAYAFRNCARLRSLSLPDTLALVEDTAFVGCSALQTLEVRETGFVKEILISAQNNVLVYKNNVTNYYEVKFVPQAITGTLILPDNATQIPANVFENCSVSEIVVSASVRRIERSAFAGCRALTTVTFLEGDASLDIAGGAFSSCDNLTTVSLPARYTAFSPLIFSGCKSLVSVKIEENVNFSSIKYDEENYLVTNRNCNTIVFCPTGVTEFNVPSGIIAFGDSSFVGSRIKSVVIPATVTRIGRNAFNGCSALTAVEFLGGGAAPVIIDGNAFYGCVRLASVIFAGDSTVREIASSAFNSCISLTQIELPASLTTVGSSAFENCSSLSIVSFAKGGQNVQFGEGAFRNCRLLTTIEIPASVTELYSTVFDGCDSLTEIVVDSQNPYFCSEDGVLYNKDKTEVLFVPKGKPMTDFMLAPSVTKIGEGVFKGRTTLVSFVIGNNVTEIGAGAFANCTNLTTLTFESGRAADSTLTIEAGTGDGKGTNDKMGAFAGCSQLSAIVLPDGLTSVPDYTFYQCTSLRSVLLGAGVEEIGDYAFYRCPVNDPVFPATLKRIGDHAFQCESYDYVPNHGELTLPEGLTEVGDYAFQYTGYTKVVFPSTVEKLGVSLFDHGNMATVIFTEGGTKPLTFGDGVFNNCPITGITLPDRLTAIPAYAFGSNYSTVTNGITTVTVPASVTSIGEYAFGSCASLKTVIFASSDEPIAMGGNVFYGCYSLQTITGLGTRMTVIPQHMFNGCTNLKSYDFTGVTSIGLRAFYGTGLTEATFDNTLLTIGANAFATSKITKVTIPASVTKIEASAFSGCTSLTTVTFVTGGTQKLEIAEGDSYSTDGVFKGCTNLTTVTNIPARLVKLSGALFHNCSKLATVTFEQGGTELLEVGSSVFNGCSLLTSVTFPARLGTQPNRAMFTNSGVTNVNVDNNDATYQGARMYVSDSGIIYEPDSNGMPSVMVFCPASKAGVVNVPNTVTLIKDGVLNSNLITGITFADGGNTPLTVGSSSSTSNSSYSATFYGCTNAAFTSITLPARLVKLGANAFNGLSNITSITFTNGDVNVEIGDYAFVGTGVTSLVLPTRAFSLGSSLFAKCNNLKTVTMPAAANGIDKALAGSNIATLTLSGEGANIQNGVIYNADASVLLFYTGTSTTFTVPATVTTIADGAFAGNTTLTSVSFAQGSLLTAIGAKAFNGCTNLETVTLPNSVKTIGAEAFYGCGSLKNVNLPEGLTTIGASAFYNCSALTAIVIPASVKDTLAESNVVFGIGDKAFQNCTAVTSLTFATASGEDGDLTIGANAFNSVGKNVTDKMTLTIPARVVSVGSGAFSYCSSIQTAAFAEQSRCVTVDSSMFAYCTSLTSFVLSESVTEVPNSMFNGCKALTSVTFESDRVTKIGSYAFCETAISQISLSDSVSVIDSSAFKNCKNLTSVKLPNALTELGGSVFEGSGLTEITIPGSVTKIGSTLLQNCTALTSVTFGEGISFIPSGSSYYSMLSGCSALEIVNLPSSLRTIESYAFYNAGGSFTMIIPAGVTKIGDNAFQNAGIVECSFENGAALVDMGQNMFQGAKIVTVSLRGVTALSRSMFYQCALLERVTDGDSVVTAGDYAFASCYALKSVEFGSRLTSINNQSFADCRALESFAIPVNCSFIGSSAFSGCTSLANVTGWENIEELDGMRCFSKTAITSVTLSSAMRTVCRLAFAECPNLTSVTFEDGTTTIGDSAFSDCPKLTYVKLPTTLTSFASNAFEDSKALKRYEMDDVGIAYCVIDGILYNSTKTTVVSCPQGRDGVPILPNTLTKIGQYAFYGSAITSIVVPEGVTVIGSYAFASCTELVSVSLPSTLVEIEANAFRAQSVNNTKLTTVTFADNCVLTTIGNYAFYNTTRIESISIPAGVSSLGSSVFSGWTGAQTINFGVAQAGPDWSNGSYSSWNSSCNANIVWAASKD